MFIFFRFRHETGHQTVGDGRTNPYLSKQIWGVFIDRLNVNVQIVKCGNEHVDNTDYPQVTLSVALPVLTRIEIHKREKQHYREDKTHKVQSIICQRRCEKDVA